MAHKEQDFDAFFDSYLETALWSSNDESDESGGEPLDRNYGTEDIDKKSYYGLRKEALRFYKDNVEDITSWEGRQYGPHVSAGHDFWLTRNGHGAGFWDGDWPEPMATRLTEESERYGEVDLYVGDDGKVYASGYEGGAGGHTPPGESRTQRGSFEGINNPDYTHYSVMLDPPYHMKISGGWEYKEDAQDDVEELKESGWSAKVFTKAGLKRKGFDPDDDDNWQAGARGTGPGLEAAGPRRYTKLPGPREGTRVRFSPNPASYRLYSDPPPLGDEGRVTTVLVPGGRRTYMRGPGGGLVYVNWNRKGVQGVALQDLEKV